MNSKINNNQLDWISFNNFESYQREESGHFSLNRIIEEQYINLGNVLKNNLYSKIIKTIEDETISSINNVFIETIENSFEERVSIENSITVQTIIMGENKTYHGETKERLPHGAGKISYSNGSYFEGNFLNGLINGEGFFVFSNGDRLQGSWKDNKLPYGKRFYSAMNALYTGDLLKGIPSGKGCLTYSNLDQYSGNFLNGLPHDYGRMNYNDGSYYEGLFKKGIREGQGTLVINKTWISGIWKDDQLTVGRIIDQRTKNIYAGELLNNKPHGKGRILFCKGDLFKGKFENGLGVGSLYNLKETKKGYVDGKFKFHMTDVNI